MREKNSFEGERVIWAPGFWNFCPWMASWLWSRGKSQHWKHVKCHKAVQCKTGLEGWGREGRCHQPIRYALPKHTAVTQFLQPTHLLKPIPLWSQQEINHWQTALPASDQALHMWAFLGGSSSQTTAGDDSSHWILEVNFSNKHCYRLTCLSIYCYTGENWPDWRTTLCRSNP